MNNPKVYFTKKLYKENRWWEITCYCSGSPLDERAIVTTAWGVNEGKTQTRSNTYRKGKNIGRSNETTATEQAQLDAESKVQKKLDEGYVESRVDAQKQAEQPSLDVMNAQKYEDNIDRLEKMGIDEVYVNAKLDGFRCIFDGEQLRSRNNKVISTVPHINKGLDELFTDDFSSFIAGYADVRDIVLDGELYHHRKSFEEIQSIVGLTRKDLHLQHQEIQYWIFDVMIDRPYHERLDIMKIIGKEIKKRERDGQKILPIRIVFTKRIPLADIQIHHQQYRDVGFEGTMIRLPDESYHFGKRHWALLKYKDWTDDEATIIELVQEKGQDTLGAFILRLDDSRTFNARPAITQEQRQQIWDDRNTLKSVIGKQATYTYQNLTADGKPRFPRVIKIHTGDIDR